MYKFTRLRDNNNPYDISSLEMTADAVTLGEILQEFEYFLRGCGFIFEGSLEIVESDEPDNVTDIDSPLGNQGV